MPASLLNDRVPPFFEEQGVTLLRVLSDRGTYCGRIEQHDYELYLAVNGIDYTKTKAQSPKTNGICDALLQNGVEQILPSGVSQEDLFKPRRATGQS